MSKKKPQRPSKRTTWSDINSPWFDPFKYLQSGADLNVCSNAGWTPLFYAAIGGHWKLCAEYIRNGADPNLIGGVATAPSILIGADAPLSLLKIAHEHGADWNLPNWGGYSALMLAVTSGKLRNVKFMLEHGADPNCSGLGYCTPLHAAFIPEMTTADPPTLARAVRLLLKHGARTDVTDAKGWTPLEYAMKLARMRRCGGWDDPRLRAIGISRPVHRKGQRTHK